jgi:hypothetical protein
MRIVSRFDRWWSNDGRFTANRCRLSARVSRLTAACPWRRSFALLSPVCSELRVDAVVSLSPSSSFGTIMNALGAAAPLLHHCAPLSAPTTSPMRVLF